MKVPDEGNSRLEQITNIAVGQISVQFSRSVVSNSLCNPMNRSMPGLPVHHQLPELAQTHVHWVSDAIQPSYPLSSPSPPALSFPASRPFPVSPFLASGGQSIGASSLASVLPTNIQDWFPLGLTCWISLQSKGLSRVFSNTTVQRHQFFGAQPSLRSAIHDYWKNHSFDKMDLFCQVMSLFFNILPRLVIAFLPRRSIF